MNKRNGPSRRARIDDVLRSFVGVAAGVVAVLPSGGCDNRFIAGSNLPDTGVAGSSFSGAGGVGSGGAPGGGGVGGTGGSGAGGVAPATTTRVETLLPIAPEEALRRLAAVLWNDAPDADLLSQAALGHISTVGDLYGVIRQMLADPRAAKGVGAFYRSWLDLPTLARLTKDPLLFPAFTPALQADMAAETETYAVYVTLTMNGSYQQLLLSNFSFLNARLADLYGVGGVVGDTLQKVALPADQRVGLLTQPALQALASATTRNSPSRRGLQVQTRLLCALIPPPPADIEVAPLEPPAAGTTLRQTQEQLVGVAPCATCHNWIDPIGYAFERFDAIGRVRATDNGAPVDDANLVLELPGQTKTVTVNGPSGLAQTIANDAGAQECMARRLLSFALNRPLAPNDEPSVTEILATFGRAGYNLKELIAAVLMSWPFLAP